MLRSLIVVPFMKYSLVYSEGKEDDYDDYTIDYTSAGINMGLGYILLIGQSFGITTEMDYQFNVDDSEHLFNLSLSFFGIMRPFSKR
ncbi:MAG: hypothetical protein NC828_06100 [Candidatus Omnitrophica bacterium]|nr:hypothetical protein [Candidatus Omnitrophota bacterium]